MKYSTISNSKAKRPTSYSDAVYKREFESKFKAVRKYVSEINKIVNAGPKGGVLANASVFPRGKQQSVLAVSKGDGRFNDMTKAGAIAARASKTLRGTQKKAK